MTFPAKTSVLDGFPLCPECPTPLKTANFIFIVVSPSLIFYFRNPEKGAFARGALRKLQPNLRKIAGISFRTSLTEEGRTKLSQMFREFESQFRTISYKYPFSNAPLLARNDKPHRNPGCKTRVPQTSGLEMPDNSVLLL